MKYASTIQLNQQALEYNLRFLREELGPDVQISSVVKGNAYGHSIETYVPMVEETGLVQHFSVFSADEAARVKQALKKPATIMIMGFLSDLDMAWAIEEGLEFFVFEMERLKHAIQTAQTLNKKAKIHIELETGMNRTGFNDFLLQEEFFEYLKKHQDAFTLRGLCTHFAGAENIANYIRIEAQKAHFLQLKDRFFTHNLIPEQLHTCCSAAAIRFPDMRFDLVRIGILQYGLWPSQEIKIEYLKKKKLQAFNLHRVLSWKTHLMAIKLVSMGDFIGYGTNYQASRDMLIGVVPVGYANGYSRALSNSGRVIVNGMRSGVIGNVNMNLLMIDLTDAPHSKPGDEVILIGESGELEVSIASFSELSQQLNYEMLSRLPMDIPRITV